jgi:hypothetical protein
MNSVAENQSVMKQSSVLESAYVKNSGSHWKIGKERRNIVTSRAHRGFCERQETELHSNYSDRVRLLCQFMFLYLHNSMMLDFHKAIHCYPASKKSVFFYGPWMFITVFTENDHFIFVSLVWSSRMGGSNQRFGITNHGDLRALWTTERYGVRGQAQP